MPTTITAARSLAGYNIPEVLLKQGTLSVKNGRVFDPEFTAMYQYLKLHDLGSKATAVAIIDYLNSKEGSLLALQWTRIVRMNLNHEDPIKARLIEQVILNPRYAVNWESMAMPTLIGMHAVDGSYDTEAFAIAERHIVDMGEDIRRLDMTDLFKTVGWARGLEYLFLIIGDITVYDVTKVD